MTWLFCALYLWESMFFEHRLTFFQSKKEDDAEENVKRAFFIWNNLPKFMKQWRPIHRKFCRIEFPSIGSRIFGIPAGPDHARQFTSSGIFCDELAYQPDVDQLMAAVGPSLAGGGRFSGVSSTAPGYFAQMIKDEL